MLHARLLKDDSSQACLDHAVRMINRERWSWWFIGGPTVTLQLPCGTTVLGFVLEQTTTNNALETFVERLDEWRLQAEKEILLHLNSQKKAVDD